MTTQEMVMNFLTGPVSALALAVTILWGLGRFAGKYVPMIVEKYMKQIDDSVKAQKQICDRLDQMKDAVQEQHMAQTEVYRKAVSGLHGRLNPIENDVKEIKAIVTFKQQEAPGGGQ
jgi:hypothetical protein